MNPPLVDLAGNLPYDVQRLAHETWDDVHVTGCARVGLDQLLKEGPRYVMVDSLLREWVARKTS